MNSQSEEGRSAARSGKYESRSGPPRLTERPALWVVFAITGTGLMANALIAAAIPDILDHFGRGDGWAGPLVAFGTVPGIVMAPTVGVLADRYGRRRVVVPCLVVFGVFGLLGGFAPTFELVLVLRLLQGLGSAGIINLAVVIISDHWDGLARARRIGQNSAIITVSLSIYPLLGGGLTDLGSWRWAFAPYGLAFVAAAIAASRLPHDEHRFQPSPWRAQWSGIRDTLRRPEVASGIGIAFLIFLLIFATLLTVLPVHLDERFGLNATERGLVVAVPALTSTVSSLLLGRLRARFTAQLLVLVGAALFALTFVAIGLTHLLPVLVIAVAAYGLGEGLMVPTMMDTVAAAAPRETRGVAVATFTGAARAGQSIGPLLAGAGLALAGSGPSLLLAAGVTGVLFVVARAARWP